MNTTSKPTAIITGATKGIGLALAEKFSKEGFTLSLCSRNEADLNALKNRLEKKYHNTVYVKVCDVSLKNDVLAFADFSISKLKHINILINNAGVFLPGLLSEGDDASFDKVMQTNVYSVFYLTKAIIPSMKANKTGHIFNINSIAGLDAYANGGSYNVSKHALTGYTKTLRNEVREYGIKVSDIHPGATLTASWEGVDLPASRFIKPEDVAEAIYNAYILSERTMVETMIIRPQLGDI